MRVGVGWRSEWGGRDTSRPVRGRALVMSAGWGVSEGGWGGNTSNAAARIPCASFVVRGEVLCKCAFSVLVCCALRRYFVRVVVLLGAMVLCVV